MKTSVFFSGILSLLLLLSSCQKDSIDTSSWLKVDADEVIQLESGTGEKLIAVSSSHGQWAATSNADWLEVRQAGDYLVLNAKSNETLSVRKAQVLVVSSGFKKALQIEQAGYPTLVVETDPAEIKFAENKGQMRLIIKSNATDWTVQKPSEDWVEVTARPRVGELVVKVEANETTKARATDITILAGGQTKTIKVKQSGQLHFFLPFSDWETSFDKIQERELARKSRLAAVPNPEVGVEDYTFTTASKVFQYVKYEFYNAGSDKLQATTIVGDRMSPETAKEFHEFLVSEGFERLSPMEQKKGFILYVNKEKRIDLSIYAIRDKKLNKEVSIIFCRPIVDQPGPMTTLPALETGILRFGEATLEDIKTWEQANGGEYDEEFSMAYGTPFFFVRDPFYARGYFLETPDSKSKIKEKVTTGYIYFYISYKMGLYRYLGMEYLTNEFKDLLKREGFEFMYFYPKNRAHYYVNKDKKVVISIRSMVMGARRLLRINYQPMPEATTSSLQSVMSPPIELDNNDKIKY